MLIQVLVACAAFCRLGAQEVAGTFACTSGCQHADIRSDDQELPFEDARCAGHFALLQHATGLSRLEMLAQPQSTSRGSVGSKTGTPLLQSGTDSILSNRTATLPEDERLDLVLAKMEKVNVSSRLMTQVKASTHPLGVNIDKEILSRTLLTINFTKKEAEEGLIHEQDVLMKHWLIHQKSGPRINDESHTKKEEEGFVHEQDAAAEKTKNSMNRQASGPMINDESVTKKGEEGLVNEQDVAEEEPKIALNRQMSGLRKKEEAEVAAKAWRTKQAFFGASLIVPGLILFFGCSSNPFASGVAATSDDPDYWCSTDWQAA